MVKARCVKILLALLVLVVAQVSGRAQTFSVRYHFGTNPGDPMYQNELGLLAQGPDGNLYGTSPQGGTKNYGTVYKITPEGELKVLYNFDKVHGENPLKVESMASAPSSRSRRKDS